MMFQELFFIFFLLNICWHWAFRFAHWCLRCVPTMLCRQFIFSSQVIWYPVNNCQGVPIATGVIWRRLFLDKIIVWCKRKKVDTVLMPSWLLFLNLIKVLKLTSANDFTIEVTISNLCEYFGISSQFWGYAKEFCTA